MRRIAAAMALSIMTLLPAAALAQTPEPSQTATPTGGTPAAPTDVRLERGTRTVFWTDNSDNETAFRIELRAGEEAATYEAPANATAFQFPPGPIDIQCGTLWVAVTAFNGEGSSEPGIAGFAIDCVPPVPSATPALEQPRVIATNGELAGAVIEDRDGDGAVSAGDAPVRTLVELTKLPRADVERGLPTPLHVSLFTSETDGRFAFKNIPAGVYTFWVWWGPGFNNVPARPTNSGLFAVEITVDGNGTVTGAIPAEFSVKVKPEGLVPWPVRAGGATNIPVGEVDVGARIARPAPVRLPDTGAGASSVSARAMLAASAIALLLAGGAVVTIAQRRRSAKN